MGTLQRSYVLHLKLLSNLINIILSHTHLWWIFPCLQLAVTQGNNLSGVGTKDAVRWNYCHEYIIHLSSDPHFIVKKMR